MKTLENGSIQFINGQIESVESQARFIHICNQCKTIFDNDKKTKPKPKIIKNHRKYNLVRHHSHNYDRITEWCPHCENTVEINNKFSTQTCPICKNQIMPCCICQHKINQHYDNCQKCPLQPKPKTTKQQ